MILKRSLFASLQGDAVRHRVSRSVVALICNTLLLTSLTGGTVSPHTAAAGGDNLGRGLEPSRESGNLNQAGAAPPAGTTVRLPAEPQGLADAAATGRVFAVSQSRAARGGATVAVLRAGDGKLLSSVALTAVYPAAGAAGGTRLPAVVFCATCTAVDQRSGRVFVFSRSLQDRGGYPVGSARVFMLDAATGHVLASTALQVPAPNPIYASSIIVDARTNRVFSATGSATRMGVLDATTGRLLHTVVFPNHQGPDASPAVPLGVDSRDGWVLVRAPDGLVAVDERTGKPVRSFRLPSGLGVVVAGLIDRRRGRVVLSLTNADETIDLRSGKVVGPVYGGGAQDDHPLTRADHPLALDQRSGRAVLVAEDPIPPTVAVVDDTTGASIPGMALTGADPGFSVAGAINTITGHALIAAAADQFVGPILLQVEDLRTGRESGRVSFAGAPNYAGFNIAVDGPTRHVFVTTPSLNSVTMLDATKL